MVPGRRIRPPCQGESNRREPYAVLLRLRTNRLRLWEVQSGQQRGAIVLLDNGGWLAATAEGDYRASDGAEDARLFRFQAVDVKDQATHDYSAKAFKKYRPNDPEKPLQVLK